MQGALSSFIFGVSGKIEKRRRVMVQELLGSFCGDETRAIDPPWIIARDFKKQIL
jgi:hypothetical protein